MEKGNQRRYIGSFYGDEIMQSLAWMINLLLVILSLALIGSVAILIGFYRMTMLEVLNTDYLVIPIMLVLVGTFTFSVALFG